MRTFFISVDMEGCSNVSAPQALFPERWAHEWNAARRWMTLEAVAAAEAALESDYGEVIIADSHGNAHNIEPDELPDNVRLIRSWPRDLLQMQGIERAEVDACAFVGYHAESTRQSSIMAHSFSGFAYRSVRLNGTVCSEGYLNAALAGEYGKPVMFVSGDQHTVEDARRYAPEAGVFVAKRAYGVRSQMSLPPRQVCKQLKEAARAAIKRQPPKPFVLRGPFSLQLEMTTQAAAEMLAYLPNVDRQDAFTVGTTFDSISATMRFIAFAMLYSPNGVPAL